MQFCQGHCQIIWREMLRNLEDTAPVKAMLIFQDLKPRLQMVAQRGFARSARRLDFGRKRGLRHCQTRSGDTTQTMHDASQCPSRLDHAVGIDSTVPPFQPRVLGNAKQLGQIQRHIHVDLLYPLLGHPAPGGSSSSAAWRIRVRRGAIAFPVYSGATSKNTKVTIMSPRNMPHTRHNGS